MSFNQLEGRRAALLPRRAARRRAAPARADRRRRRRRSLAGPPGRGTDAGRLFSRRRPGRPVGYGDEDAMLPVDVARPLRYCAWSRSTSRSRSASCSSRWVASAPRSPRRRATSSRSCSCSTVRVVARGCGRASTISSCTACRRSTCSSAVPTACTRRRLERLPSRARAHRPLDYEVFDITSVRGLRDDSEEQRLPAPVRGAAGRAWQSRRRLLQRGPRAAPAVGSAQARGAALGLRRHRGVPVARRPARGAVRVRAAPARGARRAAPIATCRCSCRPGRPAVS